MTSRFRSKAAEAGQLAKQTTSGIDKKNFDRAERSYTTLAENEEWLAANGNKLVPAARKR